jgi:hypothetical protein
MLKPEMFHFIAEHIQSQIEREIARTRARIRNAHVEPRPDPIERLKGSLASRGIKLTADERFLIRTLEEERREWNRPRKPLISVSPTFRPNPQFAQQLAQQISERLSGDKVAVPARR